MSEEINKTPVAVEVRGPEKLEEAIKAHLDSMAAGDPVFAEKLANPKKSLKECLEYIQGEVFHEYVGKDHGNMAVAAPSRAEVFGMAVHYYYEESVKIRPITGGGGRPAGPALTDADKARIQKAAEERYEAQCIEDIKKREAEKKRKELERKREEREAAEKARKESGELDLFELMGV